MQFLDKLRFCCKIICGDIMDALTFLVVFVTLICSACTALLVPFRQNWSRVDPKYFKRVKVKFLSFLFVGIGGNKSEHGNVKNYGVIIPMFVMHILGYLLTIGLWLAMPLLYYRVPLDLDVLVVVPVAVALPFTVLVIATEAICVAVVRNRQKAELAEDEVEEGAVEEQASEIVEEQEPIPANVAEEPAPEESAPEEQTSEEPEVPEENASDNSQEN